MDQSRPRDGAPTGTGRAAPGTVRRQRPGKGPWIAGKPPQYSRLPGARRIDALQKDQIVQRPAVGHGDHRPGKIPSSRWERHRPRCPGAPHRRPLHPPRASASMKSTRPVATNDTLTCVCAVDRDHVRPHWVAARSVCRRISLCPLSPLSVSPSRQKAHADSVRVGALDAAGIHIGDASEAANCARPSILEQFEHEQARRRSGRGVRSPESGSGPRAAM